MRLDYHPPAPDGTAASKPDLLCSRFDDTLANINESTDRPSQLLDLSCFNLGKIFVVAALPRRKCLTKWAGDGFPVRRRPGHRCQSRPEHLRALQQLDDVGREVAPQSGDEFTDRGSFRGVRGHACTIASWFRSRNRSSTLFLGTLSPQVVPTINGKAAWPDLLLTKRRQRELFLLSQRSKSFFVM
jgi:hypothetical protein